MDLRTALRVAYAVRKHRSSSSFKKTYRNDPVAFTHDCIEWEDGEGPTEYQDEILGELLRRRRIAVRGPHGLGKTAMEAWAIIWFSLTRDGEDWKAISTASAWRQLVKYLWPEIHKWVRKLKWGRIGRDSFDMRRELLSLSLKLKTGEAFAVSSDNPYYIEGAHADALFYSFDEAKAIPGNIFDAAEGAFAAEGIHEAMALAISTPGEPVGRFYDIHARKAGFEDWWVRHVRKEEAIKAGRMSAQWAEARMRQWGQDSAIYQNRIEGEFAANSADGIIALAWVEAAIDRWRDLQETMPRRYVNRLGVDVARSGGNKTTIACRSENVITEIKSFPHQDTMQTAGQVRMLLNCYPACEAVIDIIGIGAGVYDRLHEQKEKPLAFHAGEHTDFTDRTGKLKFYNKRSAAWWHMRELLDPSNGFAIALPPNDKVIIDLTTPLWKMTSSGLIQVESKDDIAKRLRKMKGEDNEMSLSTDEGDAIVMAFWDEEEWKMPRLHVVSLTKTSHWRS